MVIPRVASRTAAEGIVAACRYPPQGLRGVGLHTMNCPAFDLQLPERLARLNREILFVIQIETAEAVFNLEDILSVPGIDVAFIEPGDLSVSLGVRGEMEHSEVLKA